MADRIVLISSTVLQELRHAPEIAQEVPKALATARMYLVPDLTKFWDADLYNFFNVEGHPRNILETYPLPADLFSLIDKHPDFIEACEASERRVRERFESKVEPDLGAGISEQQLGAVIWQRINAYSEESDFATAIPPADARYENFPSFYAYYYTYYFRYMKSRTAAVELNDFNDLAHSASAPYCELMCLERSFGSVLRDQVRGRVPATPWRIAKKLNKLGHISPHVLSEAARSESMRNDSQPMLMELQVLLLGEMRNRVLGKGVAANGS